MYWNIFFFFPNLAIARKVKNGSQIGSQEQGAMPPFTPFFQTSDILSYKLHAANLCHSFMALIKQRKMKSGKKYQLPCCTGLKQSSFFTRQIPLLWLSKKKNQTTKTNQILFVVQSDVHLSNWRLLPEGTISHLPSWNNLLSVVLASFHRYVYF